MKTIIPADSWKKNRDRIARGIKRRLHVMEVNPGPASHLRYDYVVTAAELVVIVEEVMRETERLAVWNLSSSCAPKAVRE